MLLFLVPSMSNTISYHRQTVKKNWIYQNQSWIICLVSHGTSQTMTLQSSWQIQQKLWHRGYRTTCCAEPLSHLPVELPSFLGSCLLVQFFVSKQWHKTRSLIRVHLYFNQWSLPCFGMKFRHSDRFSHSFKCEFHLYPLLNISRLCDHGKKVLHKSVWIVRKVPHKSVLIFRKVPHKNVTGFAISLILSILFKQEYRSYR